MCTFFYKLEPPSSCKLARKSKKKVILVEPYFYTHIYIYILHTYIYIYMCVIYIFIDVLYIYIYIYINIILYVKPTRNFDASYYPSKKWDHFGDVSSRRPCSARHRHPRRVRCSPNTGPGTGLEASQSKLAMNSTYNTQMGRVCG